MFLQAGNADGAAPFSCAIDRRLSPPRSTPPTRCCLALLGLSVIEQPDVGGEARHAEHPRVPLKSARGLDPTSAPARGDEASLLLCIGEGTQNRRYAHPDTAFMLPIVR